MSVGFSRDRWTEYIRKKVAKGDYSAIVITQENDVWAEDKYGKTIVEGEAGVDDTSVIQKALDSLTNGGVLLIKNGEYLLKGSGDPPNRFGLQIPHNNIAIIGENRERTILKQADGENINILITTKDKAYKSDITIKRLRIDGNYANQDYSTLTVDDYRACAIVGYGDRWRIEDIMIRNCSQYGGIVIHGSNCVIRDNDIGSLVIFDLSRRKWHAGVFVTAYGSKGNVIENNWIHDFDGTGIHFEDEARENVAENNYITNIHSTENLDAITYIPTGIWSEGARNIIRSNWVIGCTRGIVVRWVAGKPNESGHQNIIAKNVIMNSYYEGIYILGASDHASDLNEIKGNILIDNGIGGVSGFNRQIKLSDYVVRNVILGNILVVTQSDVVGYQIDESGAGVGGGLIANNFLYGLVTVTPIRAASSSVVRDNIGYPTENSGTATFSGDGSTTTFTVDIDHGLVKDKVVAKITLDREGTVDKVYLVDKDGDGFKETLRVVVTYATAPADGEEVPIYWEAEVVS